MEGLIIALVLHRKGLVDEEILTRPEERKTEIEKETETAETAKGKETEIEIEKGTETETDITIVTAMMTVTGEIMEETEIGAEMKEEVKE